MTPQCSRDCASLEYETDAGGRKDVMIRLHFQQLFTYFNGTVLQKVDEGIFHPAPAASRIVFPCLGERLSPGDQMKGKVRNNLEVEGCYG